MEHTRSSCSMQCCEVPPREERSQLAVPRESELPSCFEQTVEVVECEVAVVEASLRFREKAHHEQEQR
jgi:hypothetical protein